LTQRHRGAEKKSLRSQRGGAEFTEIARRRPHFTAGAEALRICKAGVVGSSDAVGFMGVEGAESAEEHLARDEIQT
jgi:hypothetical protein